MMTETVHNFAESDIRATSHESYQEDKGKQFEHNHNLIHTKVSWL
jgi:hypothetical protein